MDHARGKGTPHPERSNVPCRACACDASHRNCPKGREEEEGGGAREIPYCVVHLDGSGLHAYLLMIDIGKCLRLLARGTEKCVVPAEGADIDCILNYVTAKEHKGTMDG